jgi:hypothetical protein
VNVGASLYAGFPAEFSSPSAAAIRIAGLVSAAERAAFLERIPPAWAVWVIHEASIEIALVIADGGQDLDARRAAIEQVPAPWRDNVRAHVLRLWRTREIRAAYREQIAAKKGEKESA